MKHPCHATISAPLGLCTMLCFLACSALSAVAKTNFVIIFIDDMGYGDIGPFGSTVTKTPELGRLADERRRLTSFYVASGVRTPSRAALMTGCYPPPAGRARGPGHAVLFPGAPHGMPPDAVPLAEPLQTAGYATVAFGH